LSLIVGNRIVVLLDAHSMSFRPSTFVCIM
jgi:hypothetical protein